LWWCRKLEKINWTYHVGNEERLERAKEEGNILYGLKRRKTNRIGHILGRNCLLKHFMELKKDGRM
jgi:hypothetical protein